MNVEVTGGKGVRRLTAQLKDRTGFLELTWFQGVKWLQKTLQVGQSYLVYGKAGFFQNRPQIIHPEIEVLTQEKQEGKSFLEPVYPTTEKLKGRGLGGRQIGKLTQVLLTMIREIDVPENLPGSVLKQLKLIDRFTALRHIHFPPSITAYEESVSD